MGKRYGIHGGKQTIKKRWLIIAIIAALLLTGAGTLWWLQNREQKVSPLTDTTSETKVETEPEEPISTVPLIDLQPTLVAWLANTSVDYGVEVFDIANQQVIASHQPDKQYFTASIYKFYVAYLTYMRLQSGEFTDYPNIVGSQSVLDCLHNTIHTSDSPCGEALMADLTQTVMQRELTAFGTTHTEFPRFVTTAHDANVMLNRLALKKDLKPEWEAKLLHSMETQIYSRGLMRGFADAKVASKVGFNENINFHEVGLVTYPDGRQYAVSIFSQGQGSSAPLASLSAAFNEKLKELPESAQ